MTIPVMSCQIKSFHSSLTNTPLLSSLKKYSSIEIVKFSGTLPRRHDFGQLSPCVRHTSTLPLSSLRFARRTFRSRPQELLGSPTKATREPGGSLDQERP